MDATKNDLSHNEVKLDYQALLATANTAVTYLSEDIKATLDTIFNDRMNKKYTILGIKAERIKQASERFQIACETLSALQGGLTRESIIIVNKPTNKPKQTEE
mgnify:CR=1 FL=1